MKIKIKTPETSTTPAYFTSGHHTGLNSARAMVMFGINNTPPDLVYPDPPITSIKKLIVLPETTIPAFKTQTPKETRKSFCNPTHGDRLISEFDRLLIADFLTDNIGALEGHLARLGLDPDEAWEIVRGLR